MKRVPPPKTQTWILFALCLPSMVGCGTVGKVNALLDEAKNTAQKAGNVADNVPGMVAMAGMQASDAVTQSVASLGGIPAMAPMFTGGQDVGRSSAGRAGQFTEDVDGDGTTETVSVFIDEDDEAFLSFEVPWEEGRDCYTTWDASDGVWLVITECGDVAEDELVDVCRWELDSDEVFCIGLLCTGDDCEAELCYDDVEELDCSFDAEPAEDDDDGADDDGEEDDGGSDACVDDAQVVDDAYEQCDFGEPALDCDADAATIAQCATAVSQAQDACAFLDSDEGLDVCPW